MIRRPAPKPAPRAVAPHPSSQASHMLPAVNAGEMGKPYAQAIGGGLMGGAPQLSQAAQAAIKPATQPQLPASGVAQLPIHGGFF